MGHTISRTSDGPADAPALWDVQDVAHYFRVCKRTVERMNIPYAKIGRRRFYVREDVVNYFLAKVS